MRRDYFNIKAHAPVGSPGGSVGRVDSVGSGSAHA